MNSPGPAWFSVSVIVRSEAAEAVEFAFNCLESDGTEINNMPKIDSDVITVIGYFQNLPPDEEIQAQLNSALKIYDSPPDSIVRVSTAGVENEDWLAEWKKHWKPSQIGRFVIAAPWHEVEDTGKIVVRIEPNMAFGTGTHETTRLCLTAIEKYYRPEKSFLDVGTGTGILAIAAAKIAGNSHAKITACDTDEIAVEIARENAGLNGAGEKIEFFSGPISEDTDHFEFVCANLTADVIIPILPLLIEKTKETLVLSGILAEQEKSVVNNLPAELVQKVTVSHSGEWISIMIRSGQG